MESVSWVTEDFLWEHEWITDKKVTVKENLILEALRQNLNRKFVNTGTKVAKFIDTVNSAIELTCNIAFDGARPSRACFFRAVSILLCHEQDKDWNIEEKMQE